MNRDLFSDQQPVSTACRAIDLPGADLTLFDHFFSAPEADSLLAQLLPGGEIQWRQENIRVYGKLHRVPRLTAWYGDPNTDYVYSGIRHQAIPWTRTLQVIKQRIEPHAGVEFNSVLLNCYRDGADGVAWHSDDEPELGPQPVIASVSLGQARKFQLKHKAGRAAPAAILLGHGSLLLMKGDTQHNWLHQIPKSRSVRKPMGVRVNLTFRAVTAPGAQSLPNRSRV